MKDRKRDNSVKIRNTHPATALHDIIKLILVRNIRRQNPNLNAVNIYTEHNAEMPNESYPDVFVEVNNMKRFKSAKNNSNYVWEIQEKWSKDWEDKIIKMYEDIATDISIVRINELCYEMKKEYDIDLKDIISKLNSTIEKNYTFGRLY